MSKNKKKSPKLEFFNEKRNEKDSDRDDIWHRKLTWKLDNLYYHTLDLDNNTI